MNAAAGWRATALAVAAFLATAPLARADGCPEGYRQVGEQQEETDDAIIIHPVCEPVAPTVPNLATDPNAARLSAAQLHLVDGRIANLQKAIALLGDDNPEWARERDRVLDDMREDSQGLAWEFVNLATIGFAEWAKIETQAHLDDMHVNAAVKSVSEALANLPSEEARLNRIMAQSKDPALTKAILEYTGALHRLRDAEATHDVAVMAGRAREAAFALREEFELMRDNPPGSTAIADGLYMSSAMMGRIAMAFVAEGPEAGAVLAGSVGSSLAVGGREIYNLWQERQRLAALDQNASARNQMRVELTRRLNDLEDEHDRLAWAVQHAQ